MEPKFLQDYWKITKSFMPEQQGQQIVKFSLLEAVPLGYSNCTGRNIETDK